MSEIENKIELKAQKKSLKYLSSYVITTALFIFIILLLLNSANNFGVEKDIIQKTNMAAPVFAILFSLLLHKITNMNLLKTNIIAFLLLVGALALQLAT